MTGAERLQSAYQRTTYWVEAEPLPIALRIGAPNRELDRMLARRRASRWAFISAWNPYSILRPQWYNFSRHDRLIRALRAEGWSWVSALAQGDSDDWPIEPGALILDIGSAHAYKLGQRFRQNAVVWGQRGCAPQLLWCVPKREG